MTNQVYTPSDELTKALEIAAKEYADTRHEDGQAYALVSIARSLERIAANMSANDENEPIPQPTPTPSYADIVSLISTIDMASRIKSDRYGLPIDDKPMTDHLVVVVLNWIEAHRLKPTPPQPEPSAELGSKADEDIRITEMLDSVIGQYIRGCSYADMRTTVRAWLPKNQPAPKFEMSDDQIVDMLTKVSCQAIEFNRDSYGLPIFASPKTLALMVQEVKDYIANMNKPDQPNTPQSDNSFSDDQIDAMLGDLSQVAIECNFHIGLPDRNGSVAHHKMRRIVRDRLSGEA